MPHVPELTPTEFSERWPADSARDEVALLDVREDEELAQASLPGVVHIPMGEIPSRLGELDENKTWVVMCRSGGRSLRVAEYLAAQGFKRVFNLKGGINAWSREIDPSVPLY